MSTHDRLVQYEGKIVPQAYHVEFIVLSCLVSFVGAASTLELINRRTGFRGWFNNLLLVSSAVTMGGVATWSMHFIANRAMELASGESAMQVSYSAGFTVLSFFIPILVLLAAFMAIGSNDYVSWWRVLIGGIICGGSVCGMHYLGNASISNYHCVYNVANVAGSAVIAVAASTAALSMFFVFRAMWANAWWKRMISAVILASAVSGMHWCAALGTQYRLISVKEGGGERDATVIVVICLAIAACLIIAGSVALKARSMSKSARTAQQITLAAAIFDRQGRVLVDTNGLLPSMVVTDSFLEKNDKFGFSVSHPLFHWMFQATRNWAGISSLIGGMEIHLSQLPHSGRDKNSGLGIDLINNFGELINDYDVVFRELFCVAALTLAERLREQLTSVGVLWDEILPTGGKHRQPESQQPTSVQRGQSPTNNEVVTPPGAATNMTGAAEKGQPQRRQECGRGLLMFLVRHVGNDREANRLFSAGYRFADIRQVSGLIRSRMQIQSSDVESKLRQMATYTDQPSESRHRVGLGFFGIKASVDKSGFYVLVQKGARNLLPSTSLSMDKLEAWHLDFLKRFENMSVSRILHTLATPAADSMTPKEMAFASHFSSTIKCLRSLIQDDLFDEAVLTATPVSVPYLDHAGIETVTKLLTFHILIPLHRAISNPGYELTPLTLFKVRQLSQNQQMDFMQGVHRELGPNIRNLSDHASRRAERERHGWSKLVRGALSETDWAKNGVTVVDDKLISTVSHRRVSSCGSLRTASTADLCPQGSDRSMSFQADDTATEPATLGQGATATSQPYNGIWVSQEITVDDEAMDKVGNETYEHLGRSSISTRNPTAKGIAGMGQNSSLTVGMEMRSMGQMEVGTNVRTGQTRVIGGRNADLARAATFVDVLFAQCTMAHDVRR